RMALERLEDPHLGRVVELRHGIDRRVERMPRAQHRLAGGAVAALRRDRTRDPGGRLQRVRRDVVGVGEGGLLARHDANADALVDGEAARLHLALLERPALGAVVLEEEVGVVGAVGEDGAEDLRRGGLVHAERREQGGFGDIEGGGSGLGHRILAFSSLIFRDRALLAPNRSETTTGGRSCGSVREDCGAPSLDRWGSPPRPQPRTPVATGPAPRPRDPRSLYGRGSPCRSRGNRPGRGRPRTRGSRSPGRAPAYPNAPCPWSR